jgi:hypothetical protein
VQEENTTDKGAASSEARNLVRVAGRVCEALSEDREESRVTPCTCGGRNKNCVKCDGSGVAPKRSSGTRGKGRVVTPTVVKPLTTGWMNRSGTRRRGAATSKLPSSKLRCEVCGRTVKEAGRAAHAEANHGPSPRSAKKKGPSDAPPRSIPTAAPRIKAKRRSDLTADSGGS